jgi:SAM-dependent methyltransferase
LIVDWGIGRYERTAAELQPAARRVVKLARLAPGEEVLDIACGTGNGALLAARAGAAATGLDAAPRLIEVARARAAADGVEASFVVGDAQALPFADAGFDVALSIFGVIFAADADRAFAEMLRVLRPGGRALLTAWEPAGAIHEMAAVMARGVSVATGASRPRFAWHDPAAMRRLAARHGASVDFHAGEIAFVGRSPEDYLAAGESEHPLSVAARPLLERAGSYQAVRDQALAVLRDGNEDARRFRATSRYRVVEIRPSLARQRREQLPT